MLNIDAWDDPSLDALLEVIGEISSQETQIKISRFHLMRMYNYELLNFLIPVVISQQSVLLLKQLFFLILETFSESVQSKAPDLSNLILYILGILMSHYVYSAQDYERHENYFAVVFLIISVWTISIGYLCFFLGENQWPQYITNLSFSMLLLSHYCDYVEYRLQQACCFLPEHVNTLILPYHLLDSPQLLACYLKYLDELLLNILLNIKPETLQIIYDGSSQLSSKKHDREIYLSIIEDVLNIDAGININLSNNHLFCHLLGSERDWFLAQIPLQKRLQLDLSGNGESEYQRARAPMLQLSKKYGLSDDIAEDIMHYLSKK